MHEFLHDGTVIHTKLFYVLFRGKRRYYDVKPTYNIKKSIFEFEAYLYPPAMLLPSTWKRFGYTPDDVALTFERLDACFVWVLSLLLLAGKYEPEAASAGVRSTFQSPFTFLFISRKTVFDIFIASHMQYLNTVTKSVLCFERPDHRPLLPKVYIDKSTFIGLMNMVPDRCPSFCWTAVYPTAWDFKDIKMIPVSYDALNNLVYMVRIISKQVHESIPIKPKKCIVCLPVYVIIGDESYVLSEEACFVAQSSAPCAKRKTGIHNKKSSAAKKVKTEKKN
jgi:hypothetical protein